MRKFLLYILPFNFVVWYSKKYLERFPYNNLVRGLSDCVSPNGQTIILVER